MKDIFRNILLTVLAGFALLVLNGCATTGPAYTRGYFPYIRDPGEVELWAKTESRSSVTLDLKPGDIQYVKGEVGVGFLLGRPNLYIVDSATGSEEIKECKLLEAGEH